MVVHAIMMRGPNMQFVCFAPVIGKMVEAWSYFALLGGWGNVLIYIAGGGGEMPIFFAGGGGGIWSKGRGHLE